MDGRQIDQREKHVWDQKEPEKPEVVFLGLPGDRLDDVAERIKKGKGERRKKDDDQEFVPCGINKTEIPRQNAHEILDQVNRNGKPDKAAGERRLCLVHFYI